MKSTKKIDPIILQSDHNDRPFSIDVNYSETGESKQALLFIHGFKGFKDWGYFNQLSDYFADNGFVFIKMNFSHNGTTPQHPIDFVDLEAFGNNNFSIEQDDLGTVLDWIQSDNSQVPDAEIDKQKIFLVGHSRGGSVVLLKAWHDKRIKAVSTWAGLNDLDKHYSDEQLEIWKSDRVMYIDNARTGQKMPIYYQLAEDFVANKQKFDVPAAIKELKIPVQIIHGTNDETLPVIMARQSKRWNPNVELEIVEGADHTMGGKHPWDSDSLPEKAEEAAKATDAFFKKYI